MTIPSPAELLQSLLRFDTTNPPGNEAACVAWVDGLLRDAGLTPTVVGQVPERPNLVVRLEGRGAAPPLLVHGHVDVVPATSQQWSVPPFEGRAQDGEIWGRGALDMKGGVANLLSAVLRLQAEGVRPPGDVVLAVLADEEAGSDYGARFVVERHPELLEGVRFSIGEGGGQSSELAGRRLYPVAVAEKRVCWMHAVLAGPGGHGSSPVFGGAIAGLRRLLDGLDSRWLPVHVTPVARLEVEAMAAAVPEPLSGQLRGLLDPERTDATLAELGNLSRRLGPILHNTVSVTGLRGSDKVNVIPTEVHVDLDGRLLPGFAASDLEAELRAAAGEGFELEVARTEPPGRLDPDLGGFERLAEVLRELDPKGTPVPAVVAGFTDGCQFAKLGIQNYGCLPARLPSGFRSDRYVHAADERIPVDALEFGAEAMYRILQRFGSP
jgi:acetylornithine deacetylase/succinyl-diaminopimelate desuccinylase-like protein